MCVCVCVCVYVYIYIYIIIISIIIIELFEYILYFGNFHKMIFPHNHLKVICLLKRSSRLGL